MNARNTPMLPLFAAIGLGLLAAILGLVSVGSLHGSLEDIARIRLERVRRADRMESARLRLAIHQQALVTAQTADQVKAAKDDLVAAQGELLAAMTDLAAVEGPAGSERLRTYKAAVDAYYKVLVQMVPLAEQRSHRRAKELVRDEGEAAFQQYTAAIEAVRGWARDLPAAVAVSPGTSLGPMPDYAGPGLSAAEPGAWTPQRPQADPAAVQRTLVEVVASAWALHAQMRSLTEASGQGVQPLAEAFDNAHQRLVATVTPEQAELASGLQTAAERWRKVNAEVRVLAADGSPARVQALAVEGTTLLEGVRKAGMDISTAAEKGAQQVLARAQETYSTALKSTVPALALAVGAAIMLGLWLSRRSRESSAAGVPPPAADERKAEAPAPAADGMPASPVTEDFTIQELTRRTDMLAAEAEMAAARVDELGKTFADVASEVRKLAERSQSAADELSALPADSDERAAKETVIVDRILSDIEVMATLVIEMSAAVRLPPPGEKLTDDIVIGGGLLTAPDASLALDDQAKRVIEAVSKLRPHR